jgi:hypothetical protein
MGEAVSEDRLSERPRRRGRYSTMVDFEDVAASPQAQAGGVIAPPTPGVDWDLVGSPVLFSAGAGARPQVRRRAPSL